MQKKEKKKEGGENEKREDSPLQLWAQRRLSIFHRQIMNVTVERYGALKRNAGEDGIQPQVAKLLINNPSAQPGANIAPIDEIVRVSLRISFSRCGAAARMPAERAKIDSI